MHAMHASTHCTHACKHTHILCMHAQMFAHNAHMNTMFIKIRVFHRGLATGGGVAHLTLMIKQPLILVSADYIFIYDLINS